MNCPDCESEKTQPCGFDIESGEVAIAHYVCLECYCAYGGSFWKSETADEEDIL